MLRADARVRRQAAGAPKFHACSLVTVRLIVTLGSLLIEYGSLTNPYQSVTPPRVELLTRIGLNPSATRTAIFTPAQGHGPWLLGVTAAGLIAYGIFSMLLARYRRMVIR